MSVQYARLTRGIEQQQRLPSSSLFLDLDRISVAKSSVAADTANADLIALSCQPSLREVDASGGSRVRVITDARTQLCIGNRRRGSACVMRLVAGYSRSSPASSVYVPHRIKR